MMRDYVLLTEYMKNRVQWKDQYLDNCEENWLTLFKVEINIHVVTKSLNDFRKWTIRLIAEDFKIWISQQEASILFFDGASRCNPGAVGEGGTIYNPRGHLDTFFSWGLGSITNNEVEAYALFASINLAQSKGIQRLIICGDSMMVIRVVVKGNIA